MEKCKDEQPLSSETVAIAASVVVWEWFEFSKWRKMKNFNYKFLSISHKHLNTPHIAMIMEKEEGEEEAKFIGMTNCWKKCWSNTISFGAEKGFFREWDRCGSQLSVTWRKWKFNQSVRKIWRVKGYAFSAVNTKAIPRRFSSPWCIKRSMLNIFNIASM